MYRPDMAVRSGRLPHGEDDAFVASFGTVTPGEKDNEFSLWEIGVVNFLEGRNVISLADNEPSHSSKPLLRGRAAYTDWRRRKKRQEVV